MIAVLGPGGVGGLVAAALARAGEDVVVVARAETAAVIDRDGIRVASETLGGFTARPRAVDRLDEPADALLVATKATTLVPALDRITATPALVLPLLNGLDHVALLREHFPDSEVPSAVIRVVSDRPEPGVIEHTSAFLRVDAAPPGDRLDALAAALNAAGVQTDVSHSEPAVMWGKLVRLNALALGTTAFGATLGEVRADPGRAAALERTVEEACAVAAADGAPIDPAQVAAEVGSVHPGLTTSMSRDVDAGREPELDAIPGAVLRAAARHGIACPTIEELVDRIRRRL